MTTFSAAVIAGGASTRYGSPKALAPVAGVRAVDRVITALRAVTADIVLIANDAALARAIALPCRADVLHDAGALAGVHAALQWARERGADRVIAVACDMPLLEPALLQRIVESATQHEDADVVIPESDGPRGIEPLCACYSTACIPAIEDAVARGDARMIGFHADVTVHRIPLDVVQSIGAPAHLFLNLNTPADRDTAERVVAARAS